MIGIPTKIAAGASLVALGSAAGYAVGSGPSVEQRPVAAAKRQPVEVRTQTIRRTVRIVKHQRPRRQPPAPTPAASAAPAPPPVAVVPAARPTTVAPQAAPPEPTSSIPVRTRSSGAGSSGGERELGEEHEGGESERGDD